MKNDNQNIPITLQEAIDSVDYAIEIQLIGAKYDLMINKIGDLETETHKVLTGMTHSDQFVARLESVLELDKDTVRLIARDVDEKILKPIQKNLKEPELIPHRDDILKEIEDPVTDVQKIESIPVPHKETSEPPKEIVPIKKEEPLTTNLIEDKINNIVHLPQQTVDNSKPQKLPENSTPRVDPYRESVL